MIWPPKGHLGICFYSQHAIFLFVLGPQKSFFLFVLFVVFFLHILVPKRKFAVHLGSQKANLPFWASKQALLVCILARRGPVYKVLAPKNGT